MSFASSQWQTFCAERVRAAARTIDRDGAVPASVWSALCAQGFLALFRAPTPGDVLFDAMAQLAHACASTFWQSTISAALCGRMLQERAPKASPRWIDGLTSGALLGCFAATERGSGSDPASYEATLVRRGGRWILRGEKTRVANATTADVAAVLCRGPDGLALAVVDVRGAGVTRARLGSLGLHGLGWGTLRFDDVALSDDEVVPNTTMAETLRVVEWGQVIQALCGIGAGEAALLEARRFVLSRPSFGRPLADNPVVRQRLDDAQLELRAAALLARKAVATKARGESAGQDIVMAKIFASEAGVRACQAALTVCGGWGYSTELEVERFLRDAYGNISAGLPNDRLRQLLVAGRVGADPWVAPALGEGTPR